MFPEPPGRDPGDGAPCPALTPGPQASEILLEAVVHHLRVSPSAELRVVPEELLVAEVEEVALWIVEGREDLRVDLPVSAPQFPVEVRTAVTGELAVEVEDVLGSCDVATTELETVAGVNYPEHEVKPVSSVEVRERERERDDLT